jgi:putative nucleotidyltransferase with HDIG domain
MIRRLQVSDPRLARLRAAVRTEPRARATAFVLIAGVLTAVALIIAPPATVTYSVGDVARGAIRAPRSVSFVSESLTEAERDKAEAAVQTQFATDLAVVSNASTRIANVTSAIGRIRGDAAQARDQKIAALTNLSDVVITPAIATDIADMTQPEWDQVAASLDSALRTLYQQGIRAEQLETLKADAVKALPAGWTERQKRAGADILKQNLNANVKVDELATSLARQDARTGVTPVQVQVTAGEAVVRTDEVVDTLAVEKLRALGLANEGNDWRGAIGLLLWSGLIAGVLALFLERYATEAWLEDRKMILVILSLVALTAAGRTLVPGHTVAVYFAPFAAVAMMLTVLVGGRSALATQIAGALHVGMVSGEVQLVAYVLVPALLGMAAVRRATTAREFAIGAVAVAAGAVGVILSFVLVNRAADALGIAQLLAGALVSGLGSGLLAFAGMAILGHVFGISTVFELRELGDPNHPLLRQLLLRTPGTYHHSLLVGNLAERAAEVIGADPLVARVGAYYHDIGKMRNPTAFIENQQGGQNPHDELDPLVSAGIVAAHIKDGLALADRYRLPARIREMIPGHHGTSVVRYFFQIAQQRGQAPDERSFRYPGPRPQSKEAGIVMLADGTEASVRSLSEKNPETIRAMVDRIIDERVADGQLDDCDLTFRDVERIKDAFCELLLGVYHERIPYPEDRITRIKPAASG